MADTTVISETNDSTKKPTTTAPAVEECNVTNCSSECERRFCERAENMALMAEVGMEPKAKRKCSAPDCDNPIPKWRNGRRVSKRARFCDHHSRHCRKNGRL